MTSSKPKTYQSHIFYKMLVLSPLYLIYKIFIFIINADNDPLDVVLIISPILLYFTYLSFKYSTLKIKQVREKLYLKHMFGTQTYNISEIQCCYFGLIVYYVVDIHSNLIHWDLISIRSQSFYTWVSTNYPVIVPERRSPPPWRIPKEFGIMVASVLLMTVFVIIKMFILREDFRSWVWSFFT